ncbi:MAG: hypothetical protein GX331_06305 [Firmicutes bacterium]|nr:hypothetical protein [Bacillota bacterium]
MSKCINKPIQVVMENNFPTRFHFHGNYLIQHILEHWREVGQWWLDEPERFVFRVSTDCCWCELHYAPQINQWILYRIED